MTPATNGKAPSPIDALGLTLGDLEDLETETGLDVLGLLENADKRLPVRLLVGLVWVVLRRDTPGLTVAEVRGMDLGAIDLDALAAGLPKANRARRRASASDSPGHGGSPRANSGGQRSTRSPK